MIFFKYVNRYLLSPLFLGFLCIYIHFPYWVNCSYEKGFYWESIEPLMQAQEKGYIFIEHECIEVPLYKERKCYDFTLILKMCNYYSVHSTLKGP